MENINADLNTIPIINLIVIFAGVIIVLIVIAFLIKKFGLQISEGTLKAEDTLKTSDYKYDLDCQTLMYHLQETIEGIDYEMRREMRQQTRPCNYKISSIGNVQDMCRAARKSLFSALKEPLYEYINNNHFTRELLPDNFESYRDGLIECVRENYQELLSEYNYDSCNNNNMTAWDAVSEDVVNFVDDWLLKLMISTKRSCHKKIEEYEKVLPSVENSEHWSSVTMGCINKNKGYIDSIRELIEKKKQEREVENAKRNTESL